MCYDRLNPDMKREWISNNSHSATAEDWVQIPAIGRIVKTGFCDKLVKIPEFETQDVSIPDSMPRMSM